MTVALVVNGIPDLQLSMAEGLSCLKLLLEERQNRGCMVMPAGGVHFGVQYRIQSPTGGVEHVYLTDYPDPDNKDWDA